MRITTLGAGPAGLYFSLLAKKADPSRDITVIERNTPDATFGWGVVFSEETLGALRDADRPTYDEISDTFARWDAIDIRYRDETVRSRGHSFSAIGRKRLLGILQRRCADLGVVLRFEEEVAEPAALTEEADLVVAADGVHSATREAFSNAFRPALDVHRTKFVWFGTDLVFDAFTFVFRENEHGLFQVHGYPFDGRTSTFIVECPEPTWRRAGLDEATEEESIGYCEKLFERDLEGHRLLSNRSLWTSFVTVRCESWHHANTVLLGDAAHTAHFTIGSGTKLAMEDAIALADAIERRRDLPRALIDYEMERQPVVERFQRAALDSSAYFENVRRYAGLEPVQFAFNLLTRSGRITHLELERRDAAFIQAVDGWFAEGAGPPPGPPHLPRSGPRIAPPPMFAPISLRDVRVPNRVALAAMGEDDAEDGLPAPSARERLAALGRTGAGVAVTEFVAVSAHGRVTPGTPGLWKERHAQAWADVVRAAHQEAGATVALRLGHSGARGASRPRREGLDRPLREGGWPLLAASDLPYTRWSQRPHPMTAGKLAEVTEDFVRAALLAADAGFDLLLLDLSHGYLLAGFLSPLTNSRTDEYGGTPERRLRYPLAVVDAVRAAWPSGRPLAARLTSSDWARDGLDLDEAVGIASALRDHGVDLIQPVAGQAIFEGRPSYDRLFLVPASDRIRNEARVPTLVGGSVTTHDQANTLLAAGRADLCLLDPPLSEGVLRRTGERRHPPNVR